jgi:hypothetical protein
MLLKKSQVGLKNLALFMGQFSQLFLSLFSSKFSQFCVKLVACMIFFPGCGKTRTFVKNAWLCIFAVSCVFLQIAIL